MISDQLLHVVVVLVACMYDVQLHMYIKLCAILVAWCNWNAICVQYEYHTETERASTHVVYTFYGMYILQQLCILIL